jgi:acyl-CoA synthetase (AMP-forming)/AMP-acid ligase II
MLDFTPRPMPAALQRRMLAMGLMNDESIGLTLSRTADRFPNRPAVQDLTAPEGPVITYAELLGRVERVAGYLRGRGVREGDVVMIQSPNSLGMIVTWWAAWQCGCVCVPVVEIYRAHELRHVVAAVRPEVVVTIAQHRDHGHAAVFDDLLADARLTPKARLLLEGQADGWTELEDVDRRDAGQSGAPAPFHPDAPALVLFTSGTTSAPKGVVHSSRSIVAETLQISRSYGLDWRDRLHLPVPLAHVTGLDFGLIVPTTVGASVVLSRVRSLAQTVQEAIDHEATMTVGAVTAIPYLADAIRAHGAPIALKMYATGGATVPQHQISLGEELGINPFRSYGMTECPSVTAPSGADSRRQRLETDGRLTPGMECESVDPETRRPLGLGEEGELRVRGPERMIGYLDVTESDAALDAEGWFYTGDLGRLDYERCVTLTGRIKDIINRGGEKFSARDIEDVLVRHRAVAEVAVVAVPDSRYGEVPAAFVVPRVGERVVPQELESFLREAGVAHQKTPAHWETLAELPITPSGKVKKFELRASYAAALEGQDVQVTQ